MVLCNCSRTGKPCIKKPLVFYFLACLHTYFLKGLGHAILGSFSTDQIIIELTKNIKITAHNYRKTLTKHRQAKKEHGWTNLEGIKMDCIRVNLRNVGPPFFQIYGMSVYISIKMSFTQLENHSQLSCGHDFVDERLLVAN